MRHDSLVLSLVLVMVALGGVLAVGGVAAEDIDTDAVTDETTVDVEFVGTVADDGTVTVEATGIEEGGDPVDGLEVTVTVGDEAATTAVVEDGDLTAEFDPARLDLEPTDAAAVDIEEVDVENPATVEVVHEAFGIGEGYNLRSVPQVADIAVEGVGAVNVWNAADGSYDAVTDPVFETEAALNQGLYVAGTDADARVGYTFDTDDSEQGTVELATGWNFVSSNFNISATANQTVAEDLALVEGEVGDLDIFDAGFGPLEPDDTVEAFDGYWVFVDEDDQPVVRDIEGPAYDRESREDVLRVADGSLSFGDQATASSTFTGDDPTEPGVVVEGVEATVDSAVVVTYEDGEDLVIAGLGVFDEEELDGEDVTIPVEDTGGFPGEHVAHVIPVEDLSGEYAPGDTVSEATAGAILDNEAATVFQGTVAFDEQSFQDSTDEVTVETAELLGDEDTLFQVDLHETDDGAPGAFVGSSPVLSAGETETGVEVTLQDTEGEPIELTETGEYVAMIHVVDDEETEEGDQLPPGTFPVLPNADATDGFVPGGVTDAGLVEIFELTFAVDNLVAPDTVTQGDSFDVSADISALAAGSLEIAVVDSEFNDEEAAALSEFIETELAASSDLDEDDFVVFDVLSEDLLDNTDHDAYVINEFGETSATAFLDELGDDQATIFLDQHTHDGGVEALVEERSDPTDIDSSGDGDFPVGSQLEITEDHPLFDDVGEVGDVVDYRGANLQLYDRAWFDGYTGEELGEIGDRVDLEEDPFVPDGPAVAADDDRNEILLSASARTSSNEHSFYEDAENQIMLNAVEYALLEQADLEPPGDGEEITETQTVEWQFDGAVERTQEVTLSGGETTTVTFEDIGSDIERGTYEHGVFSPADSAVADIDIEEPVFFDVTEFTGPTSTAQGGEVTVSANVTNTLPPQPAEEVDVAVVDEAFSEEGAQALTDFLDAELDDDIYTVDEVVSDDLLDVTDEYDLFIVNQFLTGGEEEPPVTAEVDQFLDALDDEQAAIHLNIADELTYDSNAVLGLSNAREDPSDLDFVFSGIEAPVDLHIEADHPLFDGVGDPGDVLTYYEAELDGFADAHYVTFDGYGGETLAGVGPEGEPSDGPAIGVDDDRNEILFSSQGVQQGFHTFESYTDDADEIMLNAVEYARTEFLATTPLGADATATQTVEYRIGDNVLAEEDVTLDANENEVVTFEDVQIPDDLQAGENRIQGIFSEDAEDTDTIAVLPQDAFLVDNLDPATAEVTEGDDPIDVSVDIENLGGTDGEQDITLEVVDETGAVVYDDVVTVALEPGEGVTETFEDVPAGDLDAGAYTHTVSSEHDDISGSLTVLEPVFFEMSDLDAPATVTQGGEIDVSATVTNTVPPADGVEEVDVAVVDSEFDDEAAGALADRLADDLDEDFVVNEVFSDDLLDEVDEHDVFIVHEFADAPAGEFLDALDDNQAAIYLDQSGFVDGTDAVGTLSDVRDDPGTFLDDFADEEPIEMQLDADHPIFEGVGDDGDVVTYLDSGIDFAFFDDYSGEVLGQVVADGATQGAGVGVNDDENEVLFPSAGRGAFAEDELYTDEENQMMENAIEYAAFEQADLVIESLASDHPNVDDIGTTATGTQNITYEFEDEGVVRTQELTLDAGESETVTFEDIEVSVEAGTYEHGVASEDDSQFADIEVQEPVNFEVSDLAAPAATGQGDEITVTADVTNTAPPLGEEGDVVVAEGTFDVDPLVDELEERLPDTITVDVDDEVSVLANPEETVDEYDAVVFPSMENALDFEVENIVEEAEETDTGLVFAEQFDGSANGISALSDATGDPGTVENGFDDPPVIQITETDHPLFAGIGDEFVAHEQDFGDFAYFEDYSGDELADVEAGGEVVEGPAIGVDEERNHALLGTVTADSSFVDWADVTEESYTVWANAVEFAADLDQPGVFEPDETGTQTVEYRLDGETLDSEEVTLDAGESQTVEFTAEIPAEAGEYEHGVFSDDDEQTADLSVRSLAFGDQGLGADADGESAVLVENVGADAGEAVAVTYTDGDEEIVAGLTVLDEDADGEDIVVEIEDAGGFPGEHTAHVVLDPSAETGIGEPVSEETLASIATQRTAEVFDADVDIEDETVEDGTSEVTVETAALEPDAEYVVVVRENAFQGDVLGVSETQTGTVENLTVEVEDIETTTDVAATLQFTGEPFGDVVPVLDSDEFTTVTDTATIEVLAAEGANLTLADQATASSSIFGDTTAGVVVEDIQQAELEPQDVTDPAEDFLVLFEGDELDPDAIVDFVPISEVDDTHIFDLTDGEDAAVATPSTPNAESVHEWNFTDIEYGEPGEDGDEVDTITVDYPETASFDGLNETDITVTMTRTLADGEDTSEITVNSDEYEGSTATFDLSGQSQTDVAGPIEIEIDDIENPDRGQYDVDVTLDGDAGEVDLTAPLSVVGGEYTAEIHADDGTGAPDPTQPRGVAETATVFGSTLAFEDQTIEEPVEEGDVLATLETADLLDGADDDTAFVVDVHPTDDEGELVGDEFVGSSDVLSGANAEVEIIAERVPADGTFNEFPIEETDDYVAMVHLVDDDAEPGDEASPGEYPVLPNADAADGFVAGGVTDDATITADIPGTISGEITLDEADPDEDVTVTVELEETDDSTTVTLEGAETSANYTLDGLDEGEYTVTATEDTGNYADPDDVADVVVEDGETTVVDFEFDRLTGGADGTVVASGETSTDQTPGAGEGIEDATIDVYAFQDSADGEPTFTFEDATDETGAFEVPTDTFPVGEHFVEVSAAGFASGGLSATIEEGENSLGELELDYADGGAISGEITLDVVDPEEDVTVTVEVVETGDSTTVTLAGDEASANYTIEDVDVNVDAGYTVTASEDTGNYAAPDDAEGVTVDVGETAAVDFGFDRLTGDLDGTVTNADGDPLEDVLVEVSAFGPAGPVVASDTTDAAGEYAIDGLPVGGHNVTASLDGFVGDQADVEILADETVTQDFEIVEANVEVTFLDGEISTAAGAEQSFDVAVENTGGLPAEQDIDLDWGGEFTDSETVTLGEGESTEVTLAVETDADQPLGGYDVTVASEDDTDETTASIGPTRSLNQTTVAPGDTVQVTVSGELGESVPVNFADVWDPEANNSELVSVSYTTSFEGASGSDVFATSSDDVAPGPVEIVYNIFVPEDDGDVVYEWDPLEDDDGSVMTVDTVDLPIFGDQEFEVTTDPNFEVTALDPAEATVQEGDGPIDVDGTIENTGPESDEQDVTLEVTTAGDDVVYSDTVEAVSLDPGEETTVTFSDVPAGDLDPDEYTHTVATEDTSLSGTLTVLPEGETDVSGSLGDATVEQGETGTVGFTLDALSSSGTQTAQAIEGFDLTITYDSSVVEFVGADSDVFALESNAEDGVLRVSGYEVENPPELPVSELELSFEGVGTGTSALSFEPGESDILDSDLAFAPTAFQSGAITVGEASEESVTLDPGVRNALDALDGDGELSLMVSLERGHGTLTPDMDAGEIVTALQSHADRTQEPVATALDGMGIEVTSQFWLGNAMSVTAPADEALIRDIYALPNVESVSLERTFQVPEPEDTDVGPLLDDFGEKPHTDGLVQSNVPDLWEEFDTQGEGASIAVLDDGVNASHPDIDLAGHVAVDSTGERDEEADPQEDSGHGTHVAGTATGGDASGTAIGVAPEADLYFGDVFVDGATESAIVGAMEWSAEQEVDVVSASLGLGCSGLDPAPGYSDAHVDAIQDLLAQEIAFVSSAGNGGEGCVSDPGNHYHSISIGASDRDEEITSFSSGGLIDKDDGQPAFADDAWEDPPAEWPQSWVAPDVAAHGNNVISAATADIGNAVPGAEDEDYRVVSGTSMSAPHVSGAVALLRAIDPDASVEEIEDALEETGFKPADWDEDEAAFTNEDSTADEPGVDSRYGHGIMDANAAAEQIGLAPLTQFPMGDVNQDGVRDETDRDSIHQHLVGLSLGETFNERLADVDRTRDVTVRDLALVARNLEGLATDGELTVDDLDAPATVEGGDTLTVSADIENVGDLGAVQNVELRLADTEDGLENPDEATVVDTGIANLAPGGNQSVEFFVDTDGLGGGDLFHGVFTDESSQTAEITIEQPFFEVTDLDAPAAVDSGEEVVVDATVENTGNVEDTQLVTYDPPGDVPRSDEFVRVAVVDSATVTTLGADAEREAAGGSSAVDALQPAIGEDIETEIAEDLVAELEAETPDEFLFETVNADDLPEQVDNFDVFLVNDFGDATDFGGSYVPPAFDLTEEFYDELDETQGAIYLDTAAFIDQGNAVQALALDEDRPIGMEPDDFNIAPETVPIIGDDPIEFEVTDPHPIFDGIAGEGERFTAYQPPDQDRVWFDDYAGEFVAETAVEGEPTNGSTIGVNEERNEIIMGLGFEDTRQPVESVTNDSIALLANAIDHVAADVEEGEDDIREVSLGPGESTTQTFTADTEDFPDALFEHGVTTGDDELFADLKVDRWFLEVTGVDGPEEIAVGDDISVDATVTNVGNATDEQLIEYSLVEEVPDIAVVGGDAEPTESPRDTDRIETIVDVIEAEVDQPVDAEAISYEALPDAVDEYDTFVIHRFGANNSDAAGDDRADEFLDELGPEQNAVYLETAGSAAVSGAPDHNYASAIERLVNVREDPTSVSTDTTAIDGSPLVITDEHPIWTGVGVPGDNVTTNIGVDVGQDYAAAFDDYGGEVIGDDPFFDAPGVAVDDDPAAGEREVLLTNAVPYEFVELPEELTEEGQAILANAIEYAAFGDVEATLDTLDTEQTVELDPDETAELTFDVTVGEDAPIGAAEHFVASDDDSDNDLTTVAAAEQVNVVDLDAPFDAEQAEVVTVAAELEHIGSEPTTETVEYIFDGAVENTTEVDLDPGDTETVTFEYRVPDIEPDEYTHGVEVTFDQSFTPIEVLEGPPSEFLVDEFDGPTEVGQGDEYTVSATIENADEFLSDTQTVEYQFDLEDVDQPLDGIEVAFVDDDTEGMAVDELQAYLADAEYPLSATAVEDLSDLGAETTVEEFDEYLRETDLSESEREALLDDVSPAGAEGLFDRIDDELDDEVFDLTGIDPEDLLDNLDKDIYLVHDADPGGFSGPSEEEYETFLDEIEGPDQGAVFLDQDTAFIDGVESLVDIRGDPESTDSGGSGEPDQDVVLHIEQDHPIFAGLGTAGDVVPLVEVAESFGDDGWSSADRLWFDGYSGGEFADVGIDGEGPDGTAVGIDDERGEILLSSSGAGSSFSQEAEFIYDEGIELIGNAVEYLTERAVFGESLSQTVELDPGESTTVTFDPTVPVEQQAAEYEHGVFSLNDSDTDTIEVFEREPDIVVTEQTLESDEVLVGQDIATAATVTNEGEIIGERDIELEFDGTVVDSETVELEEGETATVNLSAEATSDEQPSVEVTVNGEVPETVTVDPSGTAAGTVIASGETAAETPGEGDPIAGATVTVFPDDPDRTGEGIEVAETDENGTFETVVVPVGEHGIEIDAPDFAPFEGTVVIEEDETTDIGEVELDYAETGEISGEVTLDLDLDIEVDPEDLESIDLAVVNDDDEFTEEDLRAAGYSDEEIDAILEAVDPMFAPGLVEELDERLDDEVYTVEGIQPEFALNNTDAYDVFVVHDLGGIESPDLMETFVEELGSQGVVYLDQNGGFSDAIEDLSEVRGNPGTVNEESGDFDAEDEVEFEATADHPILEGLAEEGERFTVSNERDHAWFDDYSGETIAEVSQVGVEGLAGPSIAVDDDRNEVLVSSIADGFPSDFEDFTDDAFQVLANAAEHAATQAAAADPDLGGTDVETDVTVEVAETGDSTTVTATGVNATVGYTIDGVDVNVDEGYTVTASAPDHADDTVESVTVDVGETTEEVDLTLARDTGGASGTVVDADGEPVENATLTVYSFQDDASGEAFPGLVFEDATDADGAFDLPDGTLPVGDHFVVIESADLSAEQSVTIEAGENDLGEITLAAADSRLATAPATLR